MENNKINIAELLKDCPKGMELDCVLFDNVTLLRVDNSEGIIYPIILAREDGDLITLTKYGQCSIANSAKCVIFPKGKTTWDGFQIPFKDGDILINGLVDCVHNPFIFKQTNGFGNAQCYCAINVFEKLILNSDNWTPIKGCRLATEEEKQKLFDAIKANGYKWNKETKTLEKLVEPIFKVGNRIRHKENTRWVCTIKRVADRYYVDGHPMCYTLPFGKQNEYELVPDKFDINTLIPFESKVLVRNCNNDIWLPAVFGGVVPKATEEDLLFVVVGGWFYEQCIPYEANKELRGVTDDCDEFYKTWK